MKPVDEQIRRKRRVAMDAAVILVVILLMVQMWLLTATLESYLAGHYGVALPGMIASAVFFVFCAAMYRMVIRLDRAPGRDVERRGSGPWNIG